MAITKISPSVVDFDAGITISTTDNSTNLTLSSTDADANGGPILDFYRNSSSPADNDVLFQSNIYAENDADEKVAYGYINTFATDVSNGSESMKLNLNMYSAGTALNRFELSSSETVFNQDSGDIDFRVESDDHTHMLFVDAENNAVGIKNSDPHDTSWAADGANVAALAIGNTSSGSTYGVLHLLGHNTQATRFSIGAGDGMLYLAYDDVNAAHRLKVHSDGDFEVVDGDIRMADGHGIDFSATPDVTGSSSELLDNYEEGIFAAAVTGSVGGSMPLSTNSDHLAYTKIGRQVTCTGYLGIASDSSVDGAIRFALPYACANLSDDSEYSMSAVGLVNNGSTLGGMKYVFIFSGAYAYIYNIQDTGVADYVKHGDVDTSFQLIFNFSYFTVS